MHKNYKLLLVLGLLVGISFLLSLSSGRKRSANFRIDLFAVPDTSAIELISLENDQLVNLSRSGTNGWRVNDTHKINPGLKNVLLVLLNQVTIRRPVSNIQREKISEKLLSSTKITIKTSGREFTFYAGGNAARTLSYFMSDEDRQPYIVEIPGYRNYVSGIFELTLLQWRDRTLFNTHWRSLQSIRVTYPGNKQNDLNIYFQDEFFAVEGVTEMDTTALMGYLGAYELFEANEFISQGFSPQYDSVLQTMPIAVIELKEINQDNNQRLEIFPRLGEDPYLLTRNKSGELSLTDFSRLNTLLSRPADLRYP